MNKIKKAAFIFFLMFHVVNLFALSAEYELNNVKKEYIGTYIPADLELRLYQSKKFYESLYAPRKYGESRPHDVLYLEKKFCYSDAGFHDGYAIKADEFQNYKFITAKGSAFCIDDKGFLYRKISNDEHGYSDYVEYVMNIMLSTLKNFSGIKIQSNNLIIDDKEYKVNLDGMFFDQANAAIWLYSGRHYVLEKNGSDGELYTSKKDDEGFRNTKDTLIKRFPGLFKINQEEVPDYSKIPKAQLRFFRNVIYARNGYNFKSKDLQDFFNSCSWYKPNPNFNESSLRKDEKDFIALMQKYEAR